MTGPVARAAIAFLAVGLSACAAPAAATVTIPAADQVQHGGLSINGLTRTYRLFTPGAVSRTGQAPLVVMLHPCLQGANGDGQANFTHFDRVARSAGIIVAYPDGIGGCWNADARPDLPDDVRFVGSLIDRLVSTAPIDRSRVFVAGISGGAALSYRIACRLATQVRAIASVAGTMFVDDCQPARPVSVLEMHGTADWFAGGGPLNAPSVYSVMQRWVKFDGCPDAPQQTRNGITSVVVWKPCKMGTMVQLDAVQGGRHTWFGSSFDPVPGEPDANTAIWDFFKQFPSARS